MTGSFILIKRLVNVYTCGLYYSVSMSTMGWYFAIKQDLDWIEKLD